MTYQELRWAQNDVHEAGQKLSWAGMRLNGSQFEAQYRKAYNALNKLNKMLIKEINNYG